MIEQPLHEGPPGMLQSPSKYTQIWSYQVLKMREKNISTIDKLFQKPKVQRK